MQINHILSTPIGELSIDSIDSAISISFRDCIVNGSRYKAEFKVSKDIDWRVRRSGAYVVKYDSLKVASNTVISLLIEIAQNTIVPWIEQNRKIILQGRKEYFNSKIIKINDNLEEHTKDYKFKIDDATKMLKKIESELEEIEKSEK